MYFRNKAGRNCADIAKLFAEHFKNVFSNIILPGYDLKLNCVAQLKKSALKALILRIC